MRTLYSEEAFHARYPVPAPMHSGSYSVGLASHSSPSCQVVAARTSAKLLYAPIFGTLETAPQPSFNACRRGTTWVHYAYDMTSRLPLLSLVIAALTLDLGCGGQQNPPQDALLAPESQPRSPISPMPRVKKVEHAVILHLKLSNEKFGSKADMDAIHRLSTSLRLRIASTRAGEFDGDEFGQGECVLYMYGPDADVLYSAIEKTFKASTYARGATVVKRYGDASDPNARTVRFKLPE